MKGRWFGDKTYTLPELIEREKEERRQLASLFHWPVTNGRPPEASRNKHTPLKGGTYAPQK